MLHDNICTWLSFKLTRSTFIALAALLIAVPALTLATNIHNTVSVMFNGDQVALPAGMGLHLCDSTTIRSEEVLELLGPYHSVFINRSFGDDDSNYVIVQGRDGIAVERPTLRGTYTLTFEDSSLAAQAAVDLMHTEDVLAANQNGIMQAYSVPPNDALYSEQWSLNSQSGIDINAPDAWAIDTGSVEVVIAIIDDGVYAQHSDLSGRFVLSDQPTGFHGTEVAGVIGAITDNSRLIAGINWVSPMISKNIFSVDWAGAQTKIMEAVDAGAAVLNNSWGLPNGELPPELGKAFAYAYNSDRLCVAAAGSHGVNTVNYPSDLTKMVSVAATDYNDAIWYYSQGNSKIDLAAPGVNILTTSSESYNDGYVVRTGTSMAAAHVSGVASLLKSHYPKLWNDDIQRILELSSFDRGEPGWDYRYGWGRLDAQKAFQILQIPRILDTLTAASGTDWGSYGWYQTKMYGVPGLNDGNYLVLRHEVRKSITFEHPYYYLPAVWGRGAASQSSGYLGPDAAYVPIFNFRNCEVVPGSVTSSGCTLRSYVYEVMSTDYQNSYGYRPVAPSAVVFKYSVLGEYELLSVSSTSVTPDFANERVLVQWNDPNANEQGSWIEVKTGTNGPSFWELDEVGSNVTSYYHNSIDQLQGGQLYYYRIVPFTENQENVYHGPERCFRNLANPPANVTCYAMNRSEGDGGGPSQRISVQWQYPQNQLANSIKYYKAKIQYPNHSSVTEWKDSLYGLSTQFCATYWNEPVNITMYAMSNQDTLGRPSTTVQVQAGGYDGSCYMNEDDPDYSTTPPADSLGKAALPTDFNLEQNYPNPFNPTTSIAFAMPSASQVRIEVYNAVGQRVRALFDGTKSAGRHEFQWDGRDDSGNRVGSGVYFYRVEAGAFSETRKMLLLK